MTYKQIDEEDIKHFRDVLSAAYVITGKDQLEPFAHDYTEDLVFVPTLVLLPANTREIAAIMKYCNSKHICVTPRGAGTGLSGGALPVYGGVVLGLQRMNSIVKVDTENFQAIVEPGVINEVLQQTVKEYGLFYPPDPASKGTCFIGGNIAHCSGGPRALKYGTTRDYVLNLEVVLPSGDIIWTGANTLKYASGYNLTHLIIGSEGTLGIVTKIVLKLIPFPTQNSLLLASFASPIDACRAVSSIFMGGCSPSVCEFIEPLAFRLAADYLQVAFETPETVQAYLLIEIDGNNGELIAKECENMYTILTEGNCLEVLLATTTSEKEHLWKLRRSMGEASKKSTVYKEEDTVVPRAQLPELFAGTKTIAARYGLRTVCYGHAGDGNLHINILKDEHSDAYWNHEVKEAIKEIFRLCISLGGTISGEHGIGLVQKEYLPLAVSEIQLDLMRNIKRCFDPNLILNPGKIF